MDFVFLALCFLFSILIFFFFRSSRPPGLPPGPRGLPFIGSILALRKFEYLTYFKWKKEYGELVSFKVGSQPTLLLNSYRALKASYIEQGDIFSGRSKAEYMKEIAHHSGIIFIDGAVWQEHRRFVLHTLRDFGVGRSVSEGIIDSECESLLKRLDDIHGRPINTRGTMSSSIANVIARLTFGQRFGTKDPDFPEFQRCIDNSINQTLTTMLPIVFPFILKILPLLKVVEKISTFKVSVHRAAEMLQVKVDERLKELGPDIAEMNVSQATDVCEALLIEKARLEREGVHHSFTPAQVLRNLLELYIAGTDTTSNSMAWAFFYLSVNPDVQRQLQEEIDREVGSARRPSMKDRPRMPYTCAVMDEILRCSSLVPSGVPHRVMKNTTLLGYRIPADTIVVANVYGIHHDPELWQRPHEFWPGHFLDENDKYRSSPHLIAFSVGKRACLGESLARMEFFLFLTGILQSFSVSLADPNADMKSIEAGTSGTLRLPKPHEVVLESR